jgi:CBS domain-containing protein
MLFLIMGGAKDDAVGERLFLRIATTSPMELARNLKVDSVSRLNPTQPLRIGPEQTVAEAVALMRQKQVGCLLVCRGDHLVGIFTERDLMRRVLAIGLPLSVPVSTCMTRDPVVVYPNEPIGAAVRRMEEGGYRHLPVVDQAGRPLGVLSVKRIVHYLAEHFPSTVYNLPPDPSVFPLDAEGA